MYTIVFGPTKRALVAAILPTLESGHHKQPSLICTRTRNRSRESLRLGANAHCYTHESEYETIQIVAQTIDNAVICNFLENVQSQTFCYIIKISLRYTYCVRRGAILHS